jgi:murein DD-endopeptidase MepM/ murein hydrolase activator NlpD
MLTTPLGVRAQEQLDEDEHSFIASARAPEMHASRESVSAQAGTAIRRVVLEERTSAIWWSGAEASLPLEPARQRARMPRRCRTRGGYREFCQGARLVPTPSGPAAELAAWLGLGHRATALQMMHEPAFEEWQAAVAGIDDDTHLTFPVPSGHVGRGFGYTRDAGLAHTRHDGVDIGADEGADIVAARGGLVMYADNGITGMGNVLIVLHGDGSSALYAHCHEIFVFAGQYVERGQRVAIVGQTGFARAPHLHFEWRTRGAPRDPARQFHSRHPDDDGHEHHSHESVADMHDPAAVHDERAAMVTREDRDEGEE